MNSAMGLKGLIVVGLGLLTGSLALPARAAVNVNATFSPGASLSDFGFSDSVPPPANNIPPSPFVSGGVWNANFAAGEQSYWFNNGLVDQYSQNLIHGSYDIKINAFGTFNGGASPDDVTLAYMTTPGQYLTRVAIVSGNFNVQTFTGNTSNISLVPIANTDSLQHNYGWEVNRTTGFLKLFFDGLPVGSPLDAHDTSAHGGKQFYLGDGTPGGAHNEVWDRVVIADGAFPATPEPACLSLLGVTALALMRRRPL